MKKIHDFPSSIKTKGVRKLLLVMRIMILLLLVGVLQVKGSVYSQNTYLNLNLKDVTLQALFDDIQNQSEFKFLINSSDLDLTRKVSVEYQHTKVDEVLNKVLEGTGCSFKIYKEQIVIFPETDNPKSNSELKDSDQQKKKITGKVVDTQGEPLPGVSVLLKGTTIGAPTDDNGFFSLEVDKLEGVLQVSFVGMKSQVIEIEGHTSFDIVLEEEESYLDEVFAVGYGSVKRKDLTGAVSRLDAGVLQSSTSVSLGSMIQGQLAGVDVLSGTGAPGEPVRIRIRGDATINNGADPLIVVNGVPMPDDYNLNDINPNDIEALDVLKGASATAIYGSRASAGVLEITIKKGGEYNKPEISYSYSYGFKTLQDKIEALNSTQFKQMFEEGLLNYIQGRYGVRGEEAARSYTTSSGTNVYNYYLPDDKFGDANTNWVDLMINPAQTQDHYLSLRGGDQKIQYSFSYGYNNEDGMLAGSDYTRHTANFNYDQQFSKNLKVGFNLMGNVSDRNGTVSISTATTMRPDVPAYNEDGSYYIYTYYYYGDKTVDNPLILANDVTNNTKGKTISLSPYAELKFLKDFKFTTRLNYFLSTSKQEQYWPSTTNYGNNNNSGATGRLENTNIETSNMTFTNYVTYLKEIDNHDITAILGMEYNDSKYEYLKERYRNFADDKIQNAVWQAAEYLYSSGDQTETTAVGYYGRLQYQYKDRYLLTTAFRVDGSSRFAPKNRYGVFPSVALGYIMSDEPFFKGAKQVVDLLKFRVSTGKTGNDRIGAYSWLAQYQSGIDYMDKPGVRPTDLGNDDLKWESTTEYNFGVDFGFFRNSRVRGTFELYKKNVENMLFGMPMAPSTGVTSVTQNFASLTNKGLELSLSGVLIQKKDFNLTLGINVSKNENLLTKLGIPRASTTSGATYLSYYLIEEGQPLGLIYGYKTDGIFETWDEIDQYEALNPDKKYQESSYVTIPGDIKFVDVSGDGYIGAGTGKDDDPHEDRRILGSTQPDFIGGCYLTAEYKGLRLDIRGTFQKGGLKYWKYAETQFQMNSIAPGNVNSIVLQRWTADTPDAKYPAMRNMYYTNKINDFWLYDASYFKIQEINLSYYIPKKLLDKTNFIKRLNVYASLNNVALFSKYPGYNIESYNSGNPLEGTMLDNSSYPKERVLKIGARIVF